ncbi:MAG TPA: hypothetical protein PKC83_11210 [Gemmatimonadaceae bacterium]|nr:hypothetical protein [Gemmatimonadaceae bacterium]
MVLTTEHDARNHFGEKACVSLQHERERLRLATELEEMKSVAEDAIRQVEKTNEEYAAAVIALAAERSKRCGTCADAIETNDGVSKRKCVSDASECYGWMWGVDHGCPAWRPKDGAQ